MECKKPDTDKLYHRESAGMCYIDNLGDENCKLINTTLAFEYSSVDAKIHGTIDSVLNPSSGVIRADEIKEHDGRKR